MKRLTLSIVLAGMAASAQAAPETYVIDAQRTDTRFSYRYMGVSNQTHRFEKISGTVTLDRVAGTAAAEVVIDPASVDARDSLFNHKMQTADFFDSARYPAITFKSSRLSLEGEHPMLTGDLTIKGVTRPVTMTITRFECGTPTVFSEESCGAHASFTIRRSDFNMRKYRLLVSDEITLKLAIHAVKDTPRMQLASRDPIR
jgi:polyisoprenoid-binding protein YceI